MNNTVFAQNPKRTETLELNGIHTYYEVYGQGKPLFFLHGITHSTKSWIPLIKEYTQEHEVFLVDLLGHGKSSPFKENISIKSAAQNLNDLIVHLGLDKIQAVGYSYGGEILFQLALIKPDLIESMIIMGSCGTWNARDFPEFVDYLSYKNIDNLPWMREQQINEDRIMNILDQVPNYAVTLTEKELQRIKTRTLLVIGDHDEATPLDCVVKAKTNLPNGFLWIVPNTAHRVHVDKNKDQFIKISKDFFSNNW